MPNATLIAVVVNSGAATTPFQVREIEAAAQAIGQDILVLGVSNETEVNAAFAAMVERKASAVVFGASTLFQVLRAPILALAARHRIPATYEWREFVTAGGLMSYSTSRAENGHQLGLYTGRILNGAKPAELPVVQSTKFELAINLRTAKSLELQIPDKLLALADEVIE